MAASQKHFKGKVLSSTCDFQTAATDVAGPHHVWYPESPEDVATAIALSHEHKTFVRSGAQVAQQDMVDGSGGIVINLSELNDITLKDGMVRAEAAATAEDLAKFLSDNDLVLPITDNPLKSVASCVLGDGASNLMRSLGPLSDYVIEINAVEPNGTSTTLNVSAGNTCRDQCLTCKAVITEVAFKSVPVADLWMLRFTSIYPGYDDFLELARALFIDSDIPSKCDLVLDAYSGPHGMPVISIEVLGTSTQDKTTLKKLVDDAISGLQPDLAADIVEKPYNGADVLEAISDTGQGAGLDPTVDSDRLYRVANPADLDDFLIQYAEDVHRGIAYGDTGKIHSELHLASRLQMNRDNTLEFSGYAYTPKPIIEHSTATVLSSLVPRTVAPPLHAGTTMPLPLSAPSGPIPGFTGDVYRPGERGYKRRSKTYASSSYPKSQMSPFMMAYPRDVQDIAVALEFARTNNKNVVARSGGHQYTGKSSGGQDVIVLSMDAFRKMEISGNIVNVGPAIRLTKLAKTFKSKGITIPHGECPLVAIGGHAQTGGYGHLVRSFGLALDYIQAFDIVLADGSLRKVARPIPGVPPTTPEGKLDKEIFWGVLGGNAGSFGIVTNYTFECVKDSDHPNSYGYSSKARYSKSRYRKLMKEVQTWTEDIEGGTIQPGIDFMMTVESSQVPFFPVLLVEMVHANLGGKNEVVDGDKVFRPIIKAASTLLSFVDKGTTPLSHLSDSFVRRPPYTTKDGREFEYPYKKRINCTANALSNDFVKQFVSMVDEVVSDTSGVKLVFQMLFGGGAYQKSERRTDTSIPQRDYVYCFVFDLFYKNGHEKTAINLQKKMQHLIDTHFNHNQERRVFWGTFGDTDISNPEVRKMYYDSQFQYKRLQNLKKKVDPNDVFHTELTVQLP